MAWLRRVFGYLKAAVTGGVEKRMDPAIQIEQAVQEAHKQDLALRNQAARVIAHRTELQLKLDRAVDDAGTAREQAGQALRNADAASRAGDAAEVERWTRAAQVLAVKLESSESLVATLKAQYGTALEQAELAKSEANENAVRLQELTARRMELLGKLEQAKMQESVNRTMEQLSRPLETGGPSVGEIEDKINARMAQAQARAELDSASISGAQRQVERTLQQSQAQVRLDRLREELGIAAPPSVPSLESGSPDDPEPPATP